MKCKRSHCPNDAAKGQAYCSRACAPLGHLAGETTPRPEARVIKREKKERGSMDGRTMSGGEVAVKLGIPKPKFKELFDSGVIPGTKVHERKMLFNLEEVKAALAKAEGATPPPRSVKPAKATADDENDPNFDELENEEEEIVAAAEAEAQEAIVDAVTSIYLDAIQKARKQRRPTLVRKLLGKLSEAQSAFAEAEAEA